MKGLTPFAVAILAAISLVACGGGLQPVDPGQALRDAAAAMAKLKTVSANLKFTEGTISFQGFTLAGAKASVRLPSDSDTTYTVKRQDIAFSIEVVIAGGHVYLLVPFSPFSELTAAQAAAIPDVAKLFDLKTGLPAVIPAGRNLKYVSVEQVDGVDSHKIDATYSPAQVHGMLPQLTSAGDVNAVIWVGGADHLIRKAVLTGQFGDNGVASRVEVDLSGFNGAVSITSPSP
jgi:LppX/LprAFG-like lipoprotein